jgi:hypothetical protein
VELAEAALAAAAVAEVPTAAEQRQQVFQEDA